MSNLALSLSLLSTLSLPVAPTPDRLAYSETAARYLESHGLTTTPAAHASLDSILEHTSVCVDLGAFRLYFPRTFLDDRRWSAEFERVSLSLLEMQREWMEWSDPPERGRFDAPDCYQTLHDWVDDWTGASLARVHDHREERSLELLLLSPQGVRDAGAELRRGMLDGSLLGLPAGPAFDPIPLALAPTREEFLGLACTLGQLSAQHRDLFWVEQLPRWTHLRLNDFHALALEYASADGQTEGPLAGHDMNSREKTGVAQHVLNHAADLLARRMYGEAMDPAFRDALCLKVVIDVLGENNARAGGSGEARRTAAQSKFVPGFTNGGTLPPNDADSRWRDRKGKDYFVAPLKAGQRDGRKLAAKDRELRKAPPTIHFVLDSRDGQKAADLVQAPFLGSQVGSKSIDPSCGSDYREFFRSYKAAFAHWLQHESGKALKIDPEQAFAELLREVARSARDGGEPEAFEAAIEAVYGLPYSAAELRDGSLEAEFLSWLPKGR